MPNSARPSPRSSARPDMTPAPAPAPTPAWIAALGPPLRKLLVAWVLAGAGLAAVAAVLSFTRVSARDGFVYCAVAVVLSAVAVAVARDVRWVTLVVLATCAGQLGALVGLVLELVSGIAPVKADQLRALGFSPVAGILVNVALSATAFGLFAWFAVRWRRWRRVS